MGMTIEEAKDQFGDNADTMCRILCGYCTANDWYCPSEIERMAKLDEIEKIIRTDCDRPDAAVIKIKEVLSREEND